MDKWRRKFAAVILADKDAAEVASCMQKLRWSLDSFMVGIPRDLLVDPTKNMMQLESAIMIEFAVQVCLCAYQ